jgi:hypothetical protein
MSGSEQNELTRTMTEQTQANSDYSGANRFPSRWASAIALSLLRHSCCATHDHEPSARQPKPIPRTVTDDFVMILARNHGVTEKKRDHEGRSDNSEQQRDLILSGKEKYPGGKQHWIGEPLEDSLHHSD